MGPRAARRRERAERELDPAAVRRALVTLAVAGTGGDEDGFRAEVLRARDAARKVGMDPVPLFDAAAAMVDRGRRRRAGDPGHDAAGLSPGATYEALSHAVSNGSGSIGEPPLYQPGAFQTSKWRWQPLARPVSPTKPIGWPV